METVDVLGDHRELTRATAGGVRERSVRGVWSGRARFVPHRSEERPRCARIRVEAFHGREARVASFGPRSARSSVGSEPGCDGDTCAREDDDVAIVGYVDDHDVVLGDLGLAVESGRHLASARSAYS